MEKHYPERMCVACRTMQPKKNLIRVVKTGDEKIFVDNSGKANGRGAYICNNKDCFNKAIKSRALNRAFKCEVSKETMQELSSFFKED